MTPIVPIDKVRQHVLAAIHGGADLECAIHAAAVALALPVEAVRQAMELQEV